MLRPLAYGNLEHAGRLGNQLWQISSTLGVARSKNMRPLFPSEWSYRPFFSCPDSWFGLASPRMPSPMVYVNHIDPRAKPYLQDLSLWKDCEDEVLRALQPSAMAQEIVDEEWDRLDVGKAGGTCAVHIRRGDYVTNPAGSLCSLKLDYYHMAMSALLGEVDNFIVFSDDIEWCKKNIDANTFYEGIPRPKEQDKRYMTAPILDWLDLFLMAKCRNHIISNSTYSWWGAWLSGNESPLYPSQWFGDEMADYIDFRLMIPASWRESPC